MTEPHKIQVHVLRLDSGDLPERLDEVAAVFQSAWDGTPEQYREGLHFRVQGDISYDVPYVRFEAYYYRAENDDERRARVQHESRRMNECEAKERAELRRLREKYEPGKLDREFAEETLQQILREEGKTP